MMASTNLPKLRDVLFGSRSEGPEYSFLQLLTSITSGVPLCMEQICWAQLHPFPRLGLFQFTAVYSLMFCSQLYMRNHSYAINSIHPSRSY